MAADTPGPYAILALASRLHERALQPNQLPDFCVSAALTATQARRRGPSHFCPESRTLFKKRRVSTLIAFESDSSKVEQDL